MSQCSTPLLLGETLIRTKMTCSHALAAMAGMKKTDRVERQRRCGPTDPRVVLVAARAGSTTPESCLAVAVDGPMSGPSICSSRYTPQRNRCTHPPKAVEGHLWQLYSQEIKLKATNV